MCTVQRMAVGAVMVILPLSYACVIYDVLVYTFCSGKSKPGCFMKLQGYSFLL